MNLSREMCFLHESIALITRHFFWLRDFHTRKKVRDVYRDSKLTEMTRRFFSKEERKENNSVNTAGIFDSISRG